VPSYGVRFYKVQLFNGGKRTPVALQSEEDGTERRYREHLCAVLNAYREQQVRGLPQSEPGELTVEELRAKWSTA
jgi:hypothetical protein